MDEDDLRAFEPIRFQEIGPRVTYNANFCRNPMCPNFGPAPDAEAYAARYKMEAVKDRPRDRTYECNFCKMSWPLSKFTRFLTVAYTRWKQGERGSVSGPLPGRAVGDLLEHQGSRPSWPRRRS